MFPCPQHVVCVTAVTMALCCCSPTSFGQGVSHSGTIAQLTNAGPVMEFNGKELPVSLDRNTRLRVWGTEDAAFLRPGVCVTVSGDLNGESLENAGATVHLNPCLTARPSTVAMNSDSNRFSIKGVVQTISPLVVKATVLVRLQVVEGNIGGATPPTVAGKDLLVKFDPPNPQNVTLLLGVSPSPASVGDYISVQMSSQRLYVIELVDISRSKPLVSEEFTSRGRPTAAPKPKLAKKSDE